LFVFLIFQNGLYNYFSQDDFANIYLGWYRSPIDILSIFTVFLSNPLNAYRPIPYHLFGYITVSFLNLNPVIVHGIIFGIHILNIALLWKFFGHFFRNRIVVFTGCLLYGISSVHFGFLYWWSADYVGFGTLFLLIVFLLFFRYERTKNPITGCLIVLVYIATMLSNEGLFMAPLLLLGYQIFFRQKLSLRLESILLILSAISVAFHFLISGFKLMPDYQPGNFVEVLKAIQWYILRAVNVPESIRAMDQNLFILSIALLFLLFFIFGVFIYSALRHKQNVNRRLILFGCAWFFAFSLPYFLLVHHLSPYYLNSSLIGIVTISMCVISPVFKKYHHINILLLVLLLVSYGTLSFITVRFLQKNHWIVWRGEIARKYLKKTLAKYPNLPDNSMVLFHNTSVPPGELNNTLYGNRGLRLFYRNRTLNTEFMEQKDNLPYTYEITD